MFRRMHHDLPVRRDVAAHLTLGVGRCAAVALLVAACGKDAPEPRAPAPDPSRNTVVTTIDSTAVATLARWNDADGSAIYLPGEAGMAQVILPPVADDSVPAPGRAVLPSTAAPASIDLFSPGGKVATGAVGAFVATAQPALGDGCDAWPIVTLQPGAAASADRWRIGLQAGLADAMRADSIGSLSPTDSAALVVQITRAAALVPLEQSGLLRRVPFGVTKAYRLSLGDRHEAVVAVVERRLNMEASPKVERTTLVFERMTGGTTLEAVWNETQYTGEDDLIAVDLLAAVSFRSESRQPVLFLRHDFGDGSRIRMVQRSPDGVWTLRWASAYTGC